MPEKDRLINKIATLLDGIEYTRSRMPKEVVKLAKDNDIVIVYGASDDLMEFEGAIDEEIGAYGGAIVIVGKDGLFCKDQKASLETKFYTTIEAIWDKQGYSWIYETCIPHASFDILEDGEKYCRGIVFSLDCFHGKIRTMEEILSENETLREENKRLKGQLILKDWRA